MTYQSVRFKKICCILLIFLLSVSASGCGKKVIYADGDGSPAEAQAGPAGDQAAPEVPQVTEAPPVRELSFTEEQTRAGDLILVNADHAYDFEANADLPLTVIREAQTYDYPVSGEEMKLSSEIMPALDAMIRDCDEAMGTEYTSVSSAWRSEEYQQNVWDEMEELYGEEYAEKYVAVPGFSEHHTGLALDLGIIYEDESEGTFSESENAVWMAEHAHHYGFVRRYAENKTEITGISNEAWHFRYVGIPHAAYMYANDLCLEEYLARLKDTTSPEEPLSVEAEGRSWQIFYTDGPCPEPEGAYTVSGDNCGGVIVTVKL